MSESWVRSRHARGRCEPRHGRDRGASAIEFAILMPLLFLVIAGIVDFGRAFFFEIQLANSAREGVRAAVVLPSPPNPAASVTASVAARATAAAPIVSAANVTPVAICGTGSTSAATVDVQVPFQWIIMRPAIALVGGNWGLNGTLSSRAVMQCGG